MTTSPSFAFFGTPAVAVWVLDELAKAGMLPQVVVTAPDRPAGRGMSLASPPVKAWALAHGLPILQPEKLDAAFIETISAYGCDVFLVAAYGKILRSKILTLPPRGCVNVHPSLLPKYRGASPIESQILADEPHVGVSLMLMDEGMDHGPVIAQEELFFPGWPVSRTILSEKLARAGGVLAATHLHAWVAGAAKATPQDDAVATYTRKIEKEDGRIDLSAPGRENYLKYCAYEGWPGVFFFAQKNGAHMRVKVVDAALEGDAFVVRRIVPEGKAEQDFSYLSQAGWQPVTAS